MKTKTYSLCLLLFGAILLVSSSCKKEEHTLANTAPFSFNNLEIGQQFRYQEIRMDFVSSEHQSSSKDCYYGNRELILEVLQKTEKGFIIKEYLSTQTAEDVGAQLLRINGHTVDVELLEVPSNYGPSLFHQKTFSFAPVTSPQAKLKDNCFYPELFEVQEKDSSYAIANAKINKQMFTNLFAYRFDGAMVNDGPGYTYLFSQDGAMIRSTTYGAFFPYLKGWELANTL